MTYRSRTICRLISCRSPCRRSCLARSCRREAQNDPSCPWRPGRPRGGWRQPAVRRWLTGRSDWPNLDRAPRRCVTGRYRRVPTHHHCWGAGGEAPEQAQERCRSACWRPPARQNCCLPALHRSGQVFAARPGRTHPLLHLTSRSPRSASSPSNLWVPRSKERAISARLKIVININALIVSRTGGAKVRRRRSFCLPARFAVGGRQNGGMADCLRELRPILKAELCNRFPTARRSLLGRVRKAVSSGVPGTRLPEPRSTR